MCVCGGGGVTEVVGGRGEGSRLLIEKGKREITQLKKWDLKPQIQTIITLYKRRRL